MSFLVLGKKILPLSLALKPCDYFRCHITTTVSSPILTKLLFISFSVCTSAQPLCMVTNNKCEGFKAHSLYPFKRHKYLINDTFSVVPFYFQFQTLCVLHTWILVNTLKTWRVNEREKFKLQKWVHAEICLSFKASFHISYQTWKNQLAFKTLITYYF